MILKQRANGVELQVKAAPGARKNEFRGEIAGALKVGVTAIAEKGKANKAIIQFLAKRLGIAKRDVQLISGSTSSVKLFLITGLDLEEIKNRLGL